jgi:hypothetical protein
VYGLTLGWRLQWFGVPLFLFICLLGAGQQPRSAGAKPEMAGWPNEELASLRSGELTVWESGTGVLLGWATIQNALKADFPELRVNFRVVDPKGFIGDLAAAKGNGTLPDVVFVDNWGQGAPLIVQQRVVEMMGRARFSPSNGWWFQMSAGAHQATATAFLRWLEDSPHWQSPAMSTDGLTESDKQRVTSAALLAVAGMAGGGVADSVMDPDAAGLLTLSWGSACGRISRMSFPVTRFLFGNGRLAYAAVSSEARSTGGSVECSGVMYSFLVLRKGYEGWKVLLVMPRVSLEQAVSVADQFDQLGLVTAESYAPAAPQLLSPFDGERQTRFPKQYASWQQDVPRPVAYAVESSYGMLSGSAITYSPSRIAIVAAVDYGDIVRIPEPFGQGVQPHRWRVWAIGSDGQVAVSEWRTVNFTN